MKLAASIQDTIFASQIPKETTESDLGWQLAWTELLPNNEYIHPTRELSVGIAVPDCRRTNLEKKNAGLSFPQVNST